MILEEVLLLLLHRKHRRQRMQRALRKCRAKPKFKKNIFGRSPFQEYSNLKMAILLKIELPHKYFRTLLGIGQGNNFLQQIFFRIISVATCSRVTFLFGIDCDEIICSKIISILILSNVNL